MQLDRRVFVVASGRAGSNFTDPYDCDVYAVDTGVGVVLIDAGVGPEGEDVLNQLNLAGFSPKDVRLILLTHGHADHSGNAAYLHEHTGAGVMAHPLCAKYVSEGDTEAIALNPAIRAGAYPADYVFRACPVEPLEGETSFEVGDTRWKAIDTPGHCSGHMCYLMEADGKKYLFAGDSIFVGGRITLQNIWDCSITEYAKTADRLCGLDFDALLPSHFGIDLNEGKRHCLRAKEVFDSLLVPPQANR